MPEIKLDVANLPLAAHVLGVAAIKYEADKDAEAVAICNSLAEQISTQLPKVPVEEPTKWGSVVKATCELGPRGGLFWVKTGRFWVSDAPGATGDGMSTLWQHLRNPEVLRVGVGEPTPEQVEAEAVCNCDYVARGGPGATPERPVEHHPLCDINLPADKRSGPRAEQVEADLAQDEQAHARYYAQAGVPAELVRDAVGYLRAFAADQTNGATAYAYKRAADYVATLLPKEPTS